MALARKPDNEQDRLAELRSFGVLDSAPDPAFDEVVDLLAAMLDMPVALISLVDENRQWFRARHGLEMPETPIAQSICSHALHDDSILEIEDTLKDTRSSDNPLCCGLISNMRYYAGAQLVTRSGHCIGTLCVLDTKPRRLSAAQRKLLTVMARQVMRQLDLQRALRNKEVLREEIDHRVKNSLQTVASTIRLYRSRSTSNETQDALDAIARRVESIAQLHAELNLTSKMHHVRLDSYLERVALLLQRHAPAGTRFETQVPPLEVDSRTAAALGMVANEFAANAAKYARPDGKGGTVVEFALILTTPNRMLFTCRDNGLPREIEPGDELLTSTALGSRMMEAAAMQVGGILQQGRETGGYVLRIDLPIAPEEALPTAAE